MSSRDVNRNLGRIWKSASDAANRRDREHLARLAEQADVIANRPGIDARTHDEAVRLAAYCRGASHPQKRPSFWTTVSRLLRLRRGTWVDCTSCGHTIFTDDRFCGACGTPTAPIADAG